MQACKNAISVDSVIAGMLQATAGCVGCATAGAATGVVAGGGVATLSADCFHNHQAAPPSNANSKITAATMIQSLLLLAGGGGGGAGAGGGGGGGGGTGAGSGAGSGGGGGGGG